MTSGMFTNTCGACGAEESLDALLLRMIDDDQVRRLIAEVITLSFPLGGSVVRYLRLFKPAKQRLRMATVSKVLAELVPDIQRTSIERKGRIWAVSADSWKAALQVVFAAADKGTLTLPLEGNGYLYGVLIRLTDRDETAIEKAHEDCLRGRAYQSGGVTLRDALPVAVPSPAQRPPAPPSDPETKARAEAARAQLKAMARRKLQSVATTDTTEERT